MAEARSAVAHLRIQEIDDEDSKQYIVQEWSKYIIRKYHRLRNSVKNGMWPTSLYNLGIIFVVILFCMSTEATFGESLWKTGDFLRIPKGLPTYIRAVVTASIVSFLFSVALMKIRQCLLRALLAYRGWMYESVKQSKLTVLWCATVKIISGYQPSLYSCQRSLPRLPVPPLHDTMQRLIESLKPLCTEDELKDISSQARKFEQTDGPKLQKILYLRSWFAPNYVSDWWEKYVYLRSRSPLAINSNYYCFDQSYYRPTTLQASRAATIIHNCLCFKRLIDREELQPLVLRSTVPICMAQYERIFSTTRVPGEDIDTLNHYTSSESKHVVVVCKGLYYKLHCYDAANQILFPSTLESQIHWIMNDAAKRQVTEAEASLAALTALDRTSWAKIRSEFFSRGVNKESLETLEKAIFFMYLSDNEASDLSERAKMLLHGDGKSIWFDKSLNVQVLKNAHAGMNCEHSMADAPALAHMWEIAMSREVLEKQYDENGGCMPPRYHQAPIRRPQLLVWNVVPELEKKILNASDIARKNNDDLDLVVGDHDKWGKGVIKKCKISPDAFIQLALQLTYYKENKRFVQTYEASMTRLYLWGRTETVRSCTVEATDFVLAMVKNNVGNDEKIRLLKRAAEKHQIMYRDAMNGKGIDRHMFALYVVSIGLKCESQFLHSIMNRPWTLSTSQTPHTQQQHAPDADLKIFENKLCPGGGFGPVSDEGYGVSYILPNNNKIFFHVSSKKSCAGTDSKRFMNTLNESLDEMKALFGY